MSCVPGHGNNSMARRGDEVRGNLITADTRFLVGGTGGENYDFT